MTTPPELGEKMKKILSATIFIVLAFTFLKAEEVSKFRYLLKPETLNNKTIQISSEKVAMSEFIVAGDSSSGTIQAGVASVFFIIDNSASMYNTQWSDIMGERFTVVNALIDSFNTINPDIEVGVAIFQDNLVYNPEDDQIIEDAAGHSYGFIPLLKLGETYQSTALGSVSGYQILKHYMDHTLYNGGIYPSQLIYKNPNVDPKGTNINSGFSAAKQAFSNASYVPESQFIMFLSDGLQEGGTNEYIQGENTPTTFTVYMSTSKQWPIPEELVTMTENVKTNGYSNTNSKSQIHMIEKGENEILAWTLDNVLTTIFDLYKFIPQKITVNGLTQNLWQNGGFSFPSLFALEGEETEFSYSIDYKYYLNNVYKGDTTHNINFTAKFTPTAVEENIETKGWGRNLEIYSNNNLITEITPEMDKFEVRFTPYKVDTIYGYSNVEVEISTSNTNPDKDTFMLTPSGNYFAYTFNRENDIAVIGDNKVQLRPGDNLIAVFRNEDLPLDTLRIEMTSTVPDEAILNSATYFDNNADGHVDSMFIDVSGADLDSDLDAIVNNILLPDFRKLVINNYNKNGNGIGLNITEDNTAITTYITNDDILEVANNIKLVSGAPFNKKTVKIIDSIAPVIMSATLVDSVKETGIDILTISFSEEVKIISDATPFVFYSMPGNFEYEVTLNKMSQSGISAEFEVLSINGEIKIDNGDSVNINWAISNKISDQLSNKQNNESNRKVEINVNVIPMGISITDAVYFDRNADGYIDEVFVEVDVSDIKDEADELFNALDFPEFRKFYNFKYVVQKHGLLINLNQDITIDEINTSSTIGDIIVVSEDVKLNYDVTLLKSIISVRDSMAPVIIKAMLIDSLNEMSKDELIVTFSESVGEIEQNVPFSFKTPISENYYNVALNLKNQKGKGSQFWIESVNGQDKINEGDSLKINWIYNQNIYDLLENDQNNPLNRAVSLEIIEISDSYNLIVKSTLFSDNTKIVLPDHFFENEELEEILCKFNIGNNTVQGLSIITLTPDDTTKVTEHDSLSGDISMYDAVGNKVMARRNLIYDKIGKRLIFLWNGKNGLGRSVGSGSYVAIFNYNLFYKNNIIHTSQVKKVVGAKK